MTVDSTASSQHDQPATGARRSAILGAMQVVLWLLAVAVFAQAVFAGLFLDGGDAWRGWHATNGMLVLPLLALVQVVLAVLVWRRGRGPGWLTVASVGLLVALLVQNVMGMTSQVAVHVPLGVAIVGLIGTLLARARTMSRPVTQPTS
jgi:cytochrome bd-type quinol oxidase subunit 2